MTLLDRIQKWWSPAQWKDDHPSQATESPQGENKHWWQGGRWFFRVVESDHTLDSFGPDIERDFKKPPKSCESPEPVPLAVSTQPFHIKPLARWARRLGSSPGPGCARACSRDSR